MADSVLIGTQTAPCDDICARCKVIKYTESYSFSLSMVLFVVKIVVVACVLNEEK